MDHPRIERHLVRRPELAKYGLKGNNDTFYYSLWTVSGADGANGSGETKGFLSREEAEAYAAGGSDSDGEGDAKSE